MIIPSVILSISIFYLYLNQGSKWHGSKKSEYYGLTSVWTLYFLILFTLNSFVTSINFYFIISLALALALISKFLIFNWGEITEIKIYFKKLFVIYTFTFILYMIFDKNIYNQIYNWDDYSHWMRMYKIYSIFGLDHLKISELVLVYNSFPNNIIQHYPAIHSYVGSILFPYPKFDTYNIYLLQIFFMSIILIDIYLYLKVPINKLLLFLFISLVIFSGSTPLNHNLLADIVISDLIILALIQFRNNSNKYNLLLSGSLFAYSIMIKPPTALVLVFIALINIMFINNKLKSKNLIVLITFISIPYILFLLIYVSYLNINTTIQSHREFIGILNSVVNNLVGFFRFEFLGPILSLEPSKSFVNLISIFFICWCFFIRGDKKNVIYIISTLFLYLLYLAITYNFVILDSSGGRFASFDRYFLSYYIYIIFYYLYYFFSNTVSSCKNGSESESGTGIGISSDTWVLLILLLLNVSYFMPKILLLLIPITTVIYLLRNMLQNKLSLINYLLIPFFLIALNSTLHKFYPNESMIENGNFLQQFSIISRGSTEYITIEVCNPNGYDYLALSYYSDFTNNFSIAEAVNCNDNFKYRFASNNITIDKKQ
jgi:hypothetical protein